MTSQFTLHLEKWRAGNGWISKNPRKWKNQQIFHLKSLPSQIFGGVQNVNVAGCSWWSFLGHLDVGLVGFWGMKDYTFLGDLSLLGMWCGELMKSYGNHEKIAQMVYVETLVYVYLVKLGRSLHVVFAREPAEHDFDSRW